jgi:glycosyltransferase involved in cell wall biosynthesis
MQNSIAIDLNSVVHGSRAVRRCTDCLVSELIELGGFKYNLFCLDNGRFAKKSLAERPYNAQLKVFPIPNRILVPLWKRYSWPPVETILCKSDILFTNEFYFPPTRNAIVLATIHGLAYKVIPEKIPPGVVEALEQGLAYLLKHADYFVCVSETTKKELMSVVGIPSDRIYVVTHGVDKRFIKLGRSLRVKSILRNEIGIKRPYILYVGAIGIHKNIMGLLKAYRKLDRNIQHDLVLAGPADSAWDCAHQYVNEWQLQNRIHFLGHLQNTNMLNTLYNGATLCVFPSFYEGWTCPPLEAMACGTPVITSNVSSLPETVGDAAIKVDPDDVDRLAYEIGRILANKSLQRNLIAKGLLHVRSHTWERASLDIIEVFRDILRKGRWKRFANEHCS